MGSLRPESCVCTEQLVRHKHRQMPPVLQVLPRVQQYNSTRQIQVCMYVLFSPQDIYYFVVHNELYHAYREHVQQGKYAVTPNVPPRVFPIRMSR